MVKSKSSIQRNLRELRRVIDDPNECVITARIAYAMECAVRWVTEDTVGWPSLANEARAEADILKKEVFNKAA